MLSYCCIDFLPLCNNIQYNLIKHYLTRRIELVNTTKGGLNNTWNLNALNSINLDIINSKTYTSVKQTKVNLFSAPCSTSSDSSPLHSSLKRLAPVRLPSPPMTHRLVMPRSTRLWAAFRRPSWVRNSLQRALPMTVPPWWQQVWTDLQLKSHFSFAF